MTERFCKFCGQPLVRQVRLRQKRNKIVNEWETPKRFLVRKFCNQYCSNTYINRSLWADEAYRARRKRSFTAEQRLQYSEAMRQLWQDGTLRVHSIANKRRSTPNWNGLSEDDVRAIIVDPRSYRVIGAEYDIAADTVGSIKRGRNYRDLEDRPEPVFSRPGRSSLRRITDDEIRAIISEPGSYTSVAQKYGISRSYVGDLKARKYRKVDKI